MKEYEINEDEQESDTESDTELDHNLDEIYNLSYKQVSSMKLSYFLEIFFQQSHMHVCSLQWA